jgi:uncharacterized protein
VSHSDSKENGGGDVRPANKLAGETSTYLLQHAHNPVEWYPWGPEALSRARAEDKPILLSIGYSACHWCHVMAHESFEDENTAALMNRHFINIKVDREERPDIDEIYMKSVQLLSGHGGWPMTVFMTPELKPFYAGTYYPPQDRHGLPSFKRVLLGVINAWESQRTEVEVSSEKIVVHLNLRDPLRTGESDLNSEMVDRAFSPLLEVFDRTWGGFGGAPKFPHTSAISLALRQMRLRPSGKTSRNLECEKMVATTLDRMAWGGIHDQLGGGFARYSTDHRWLVPHFEKMLYDNALIASNYFDAYLITGRAYWLSVGRSTLEFMLRELAMPEGGFYCSLDADSEGVEGKYYVWTRKEIEAALGAADAGFACDVFGVDEDGNFENGASVLSLPGGHEEIARRHGLSESEFWVRLNLLKARLLSERERRVRPGRDDKMLTSWTALAISALVDGARVTGDLKYLEAARRSAVFILEKLVVDGRLARTYGRGEARLNAYLDDYAYLIQALLDLAACDGDARWFVSACSLNDFVIAHFYDAQTNDFNYTSDDHEDLIVKTRHYYDGSTPSATSVAVMNLIRLSRLTGRPDFLEKAAATIKNYTHYFRKAPDQFASMLCALDAFLEPPLEIAVLFDADSRSEVQDLLSELNRVYLPCVAIVLADLSSPGYKDMLALCPLLQNRSLKDNKATVYICRNFVCQNPMTGWAELATAIRELTGQ